ncbi:MAG: hypothetical protein JZU49_00975 [Sulfuricurvum sp.]|nr:hypothetical protein [Sulfuricurvum sp.]
MEDYNRGGRLGWYNNNGTVMSFQMGVGAPVAINTEYDSIDMNQSSGIPSSVLLNVAGNKVLVKGSNNMLPDEIKLMFGTNRILPELIDKQYRLLYGKGLFVYRQIFDDKKLVRDWQNNETIENWLGEWQRNGLSDSPEQYIDKVIKDLYYFEDYWSKWRFFKARRIGAMPVAGLEHVENYRGRLATTKAIDPITRNYEDKDFDQVILGNWGASLERNMQVYPRFRSNMAFDYPVAVSYHKHHSPGEVYGMNKFYFGIKDWLVATNRNPRYINSYLENSLSAKVHVIIPNEWVEYVTNKLHGYCEANEDFEKEGKELMKPNGIEVGTEYHDGLLDAYIKAEMRKLTEFLSGVKNQGKTFTTFKYPTDKGDTVGWEILPLDMKYREYITALNDYDKRADEVITSSIGIDSSISNISKDGVISKSGSDAYYNYILYLYANLPTAERVSCSALNEAININFPALYKQGFRIGLYTEVPSQQQDISPNDRLQNQQNQHTEQINKRLDHTDQKLSEILNHLKP